MVNNQEVFMLVRTVLAVVVCCASSWAAGPWRIAGPPPGSWQRDRVADLAARRKAVMERIGPRGVLILYAAEPRSYAGDVDWPYRQENNFFYLTGMPQEGSALVLMPGAEKLRAILFVPPSDPAREDWTGHILTHDEAREISGIDQVWDSRQLNRFLALLLPQAKDVFAGGAASGPAPPLPEDLASQLPTGPQIYMITHGSGEEYRREQELAKKLAALAAPIAVKDATPIFSALRRVKSRRELDVLRHAEEITAEAFQRVYALAVAGAPEYEIQAQFEFTFLRRDAHWGYPCIVASGVNATTLHYETNRATMKRGDLLLMDDGAEFDGYSVDVTRTIPVGGKYSREQAEIYRLVWEAQQAGIRMALSGHTSAGNATSIQGAANEVFRRGLFRLGLITDENSDRQLHLWFNHGISHGIGLNVHDPGGRELQPGMVVTVEPGLYFRPDALANLPRTPENESFIAAVRPAFQKYKGIGVRIEDDVLITNGQPEVLSAAVPSKLEDVEASIARLRNALKTNPLP
jgi:Xaa-Pro aminopeptidase